MSSQVTVQERRHPQNYSPKKLSPFALIYTLFPRSSLFYNDTKPSPPPSGGHELHQTCRVNVHEPATCPSPSWASHPSYPCAVEPVWSRPTRWQEEAPRRGCGSIVHRQNALLPQTTLVSWPLSPSLDVELWDTRPVTAKPVLGWDENGRVCVCVWPLGALLPVPKTPKDCGDDWTPQSKWEKGGKRFTFILNHSFFWAGCNSRKCARTKYPFQTNFLWAIRQTFRFVL